MKLLDDIALWIAVWSELLQYIGLGLILGVSGWGVINNGLGNFFNLRIGPRGLILIWSGVILILISKKISNYLRGK